MLSVTKREFDDFLFPAFAIGSSKDEGDLEIAFRVRRRFRVIAKPEVMDPERVREIIKMGNTPVPSLKLEATEEELFLEEDEYRLIKDRVIAYIPRVSNAIADELYEFVQKVKDAPEPTKQLKEEK